MFNHFLTLAYRLFTSFFIQASIRSERGDHRDSMYECWETWLAARGTWTWGAISFSWGGRLDKAGGHHWVTLWLPFHLRGRPANMDNTAFQQSPLSSRRCVCVSLLILQNMSQPGSAHIILVVATLTKPGPGTLWPTINSLSLDPLVLKIWINYSVSRVKFSCQSES